MEGVAASAAGNREGGADPLAYHALTEQWSWPVRLYVEICAQGIGQDCSNALSCACLVREPGKACMMGTQNEGRTK